MRTDPAEQSLIPRQTISTMVDAWNQTQADVRQAFATLHAAEQRLKLVFKDSHGFDLSGRDHFYRVYEDPTELFKHLKKQVWRSIVDRTEIRRILSVKRSAELDKQLETGEGMPPITESNILAMMEQTFANLGTMMEEAVREVFEYLRPPSSRYKTNTEFEIGERVILSCAIEHGWSGRGWRVSHWREDKIRSIDNVFHVLDGNGTVRSTRGPLIDTIEKIDGRDGSTDYFDFKCFHNQNLHLKFRRLDLVAKLNAVAGGMRLRPGQ